jgi:splicing factor 1
VNTKDQRAKQKLEQERAFLIEKVFKIYPSFKPPYDYRPEQAKKTMKIYIPVKKYPDYNFIGLIIGPRGMTQKQLEKESGARILIRGKGSVKEGRANNQENDDDLHVLITADTRKQLRRAAKMVKKILVPVEESKNKHKIEQLRELARINGTLRENNEWQPRTWKSADVYCKHCGELSHPTSDCPLKGKPVDKALIDQEYNNFMKEIGDTTELDAATSEVEASYQQFMAFLKVKPNSNNSNPSSSPTEGMPGIVPPGTVGAIPPWQMPLYPQQPPVNQWPPAYNAAPPTYWAGPSGYGAPLPWR